RGPAGGAERVPEDEPTELHVVETREPGAHDPDARGPAREEDGRRPVAYEELLSPLDEAQAQLRERAGARDQTPPRVPPDQVAGDPADGRGRSRRRDDEGEREVSLRREDAAGDEAGLAGKRNPRRLPGDHEEEARVAERAD